MDRKRINLGAMINRRQKADKAASEPQEAKPAAPQHTPADDIKLAEAYRADAQALADSITPYSRYKTLQRTDPTAAGEYWRANRQAILGCYNH